MSHWSDDLFLDRLRDAGDAAADRCVQQLIDSGDVTVVNRLFAVVKTENGFLAEDVPKPLRAFVEEADRTPFAVDFERISRGQRAFLDHAAPAALCLLASSLPQGYSAPNLSRILHLSGNLDHHPYQRLLGVLQMVVDVNGHHDFGPGGSVHLVASELRLLHAGIRRIVPHHLPRYRERYGVPVNLEDMLGTIMGFSLLVIRGLQRLDVDLSADEAEDLYYVWHVFARLVGIHPPDDPASPEYVPRDLAAADEFYTAYGRRHFVDAEKNPEGVELTRVNLDMMENLLPKPIRVLGGRAMLETFSLDLLGDDGARRVGLSTRQRPVLNACLLGLLKLFDLAGESADPGGEAYARLSRHLFQDMIDRGRGQVRFIVPERLADLRKLV